MTKYNKKNINKKMLIILVIFLFILLVIVKQNYKIKSKTNYDSQINQEISINNSKIEEPIIKFDNQIKSQEYHKDISQKTLNWKIIIPEINLDAEIGEGTSKDTMNKYVGHFEETKLEHGNIGLAAHNRGYPVNFFHNIKKLKIGSEITYIHGDFEMTYIVETIKKIENTNWKYLKNTKDNRITLITCVENEPKYRRCIQGIEKVESEEF